MASGSGTGNNDGSSNGDSMDLHEIIDGIDDPDFWTKVEMARDEAEILEAVRRAMRARRTPWAFLLARSGDEEGERYTPEDYQRFGKQQLNDPYWCYK
jgi:hypothetical protein